MQIVSKQLYSLCKHTFCKNHTHFIIEMVLSFSKPLFLTSIKIFRIPTPNVKPQFVQHSSCVHFPPMDAHACANADRAAIRNTPEKCSHLVDKY